MKKRRQEEKKNIVVLISIAFLGLSISLKTVEAYNKYDTYEINYEYVNIKDMAAAKIANKQESTNILDTLFKTQEELTEVELLKEEVEEKEMEAVEKETYQKEVWRLPTEIGIVTQNPHYGHAALDITSPRGTRETIFPVANGVISSIYTDNAGALVVTVLHTIDGKKYTSQYAHLSSYASGIYVGKEVTVNDSLGQMGTTGYSTGVHLHLAVLDCALFDSNDPNCYDLNAFFRYANMRVSQGYWGLGNYIVVPGEWYSR